VYKTRNPAKAPAQFAATDMLHRRVCLPLRLQLPLQDAAIDVKTNSILMGEAILERKPNVSSMEDCCVAEWEIAVEECNEFAPSPIKSAEEEFETCCFGPSCSIRMNNGSWFAFTPPLLSGVGFAIVTGGECQQVQQLATYIEMICSFVSSNSTELDPLMEAEAMA
jgi:hypothetical protein